MILVHTNLPRKFCHLWLAPETDSLFPELIQTDIQSDSHALRAHSLSSKRWNSEINPQEGVGQVIEGKG